jgi:hypothetical protein
MSETQVVIIYPQSYLSIFKYYRIVSYFSKWIDDVVLVCRSDFSESIKSLYKNHVNISFKLLDLDNFVHTGDTSALTSILNNFHSDSLIKGYEEFDVFRKADDNYFDVFSHVIGDIVIDDLYIDDFNSNAGVQLDSVENNLYGFSRDLVSEKLYTNQLKKFYTPSYCLITSNLYVSKAYKIGENSINLTQLFPDNDNVLNMLDIIIKSNSFIIGDDYLAAMLYSIQSSSLTEFAPLRWKYVYFHLAGKPESFYPQYTTNKLQRWIFFN